MARMDHGRWHAGFWLVIASVAPVAAGLLSPARVLARLEGPAERFRDELAQGITMVRLALVAVALLALASLAWWRGTPETESETADRSLSRTDWLLAVGLFLLATILALPNLTGSFWWDELTSLSLVVKRGPPVILAYSCKANNHVLNSLGMWLAWQAFGDSEAAVRLPAFLLGASIAPAIYLTLARRWGRGAAALAGSLAALHLGIANHTVEARGYAGAILCSFLACACYASLLRCGRAIVALFYIAFSLAAIGFLTTTILVPVAHGLIGLFVALRGQATARAFGRHAVFACLWVGVLAMVLFGLSLPQTWHYARTEAAHDHLPLGLPLLEASAGYLAGSASLPAALVLLGLSASGWTRSCVGAPFFLAFLGPVVAAFGWMLLPGALLSARFLCFLIPAMVLGLALALGRLARGGILARAALIGAVVVWLAVTFPGHLRWQALGNPDLKDLARRLRGNAIALLGSQADVNQHYFPEASLVRQPRDLLDMPAIEYVVQGKVGAAEPDQRMFQLGFSFVDRLDSASPGRTNYFIYHRGQTDARRIP